MTEKKKVGFAVMSKEKKTTISAIGGRASHIRGTGHEWNSETARAAALKAVAARAAKRAAAQATPSSE